MLATIQNISFALEFADSDLAMKILRETNFGSSLPPINGIINPRSKLLATAFPELPDDLAVEVMREHLIEFYRLNISFRDHLTNRYLFQGHFAKNEQQTILLNAIRKNNEVLAEKTIGEWVRLFDQTYPPEERTQEEIIPFCTKIFKDSSQSEQQIAVLKDILGVYETLLITQLIDIIDTTLALKNIRKRENNPEQNLTNTTRRRPSLLKQTENLDNNPSQKTSEIPQKNIIRLSLKKAIERYPRIMNERITDNDIIFRGSDGPVIPSVKNWITAYHQEMGSGTHEPYERSEFLFHNKSAILLSQQERNVLSEVLRSLDEESELPINPDTQSIDILQIEQITLPTSTNNSPNKPSEQKFAQPFTSAQNVPAAERSAASLYSKESIDDRKDVWHTTPKQNTEPRSFNHPMPSANERSFTRNTQPEIIPTQSIPPRDSKQIGTSSFSQNLTGGHDPQLRQNPTPKLEQLSTKDTTQNWQGENMKKPATINSNLGNIEIKERQKEWEAPSSSSPQSQIPPLQRNIQREPHNPATRMQQVPHSAIPLPQTIRPDYTDYYPIPKEPKRPTQSTPSKLSFSSPHTFPVEKIEKQSIERERVPVAPTSQKNTPNNRPQQSQRQPSFVAGNSQNSNQNSPSKQQPKRMIIG